MSTIKKFVAIGPESTGKSTLCQMLANHYQTYWCEEYARKYLLDNGNAYTYDDLLLIAKGQLQLEDTVTAKAARNDQSLIFIDTDMYVMKVWCEYVFNNCHPFILNQIAERRYDGYLLCHPDLPWEKDPLREYPHPAIRKELFQYYLELLSAQSAPWVHVAGTNDQRLTAAITFVNEVAGNI